MRMSADLMPGIILVLLGVSLLLRVLLGIDFPIFRVLLAGFLIYTGINLLHDTKKNCNKKHTVWFREQKIVVTPTTSSCFSIGCAKSILDFSSLESGTNAFNVSIFCSSGTVIINKRVPTQIIINSGFASTALPTDDTIIFGNYTYKNHPQTIPALIIRTQVVFGALSVVEI
jgi:uncharacterized membrane protein YfcA